MITLLRISFAKSRVRRLLAVISSVTILSALLPYGYTVSAVWRSSSVTIDNKFFGLHIRWGATSTPWPFIHFYSWRVITPKTDWRGIEPSPGIWKFKTLDKAVARARQHGIEILLTLGQTPTWASSRPDDPGPYGMGESAAPARLSDWETYVRKVVTRYKGRIHYYELWNEPHFSEVDSAAPHSGYFGSASEMVQLARITRHVLDDIDPSAKLVGPSIVSTPARLKAFLRAGGGRYIDVVGYHFYMLPDRIPEVAASIRRIMHKYGVGQLPLWNTESGFLVDDVDKKTKPVPFLGPIGEHVLSRHELPGEILKAMIYAAVSGISRFYYYSWDIPTMDIMAGRGTVPNAASAGFSQVLHWLRGATLTDCPTKDGPISECRILSSTGQHGILVWTKEGRRSWTIPRDFSAVGYENIDGHFNRLRSHSRSVTVGPTPILLRHNLLAWS